MYLEKCGGGFEGLLKKRNKVLSKDRLLALKVSLKGDKSEVMKQGVHLMVIKWHEK